MYLKYYVSTFRFVCKPMLASIDDTVRSKYVPFISTYNELPMHEYVQLSRRPVFTRDGCLYSRRIAYTTPHTQIEFYETSTTHSFHSCTETRPLFLSHSFQPHLVVCDRNGKYFYYVMAFVEPIRRASVEVSLALAPSRSVRAHSLEAFDFRVTTYASLLACVSSLLMQKFHDGRS